MSVLGVMGDLEIMHINVEYPLSFVWLLTGECGETQSIGTQPNATVFSGGTDNIKEPLLGFSFSLRQPDLS